jgi:hypothetical protein
LAVFLLDVTAAAMVLRAFVAAVLQTAMPEHKGYKLIP